MERKLEFDYLRDWHRLSDEQLKIISKNPESQKMLNLLIEWLGDKNEKKEIISQETFPGLVHQMHFKMVDGSKKLGRAIIESADYGAEGKIEDAIRVFKEFIQSCPSEFYIKIARAHLKDLER